MTRQYSPRQFLRLTPNSLLAVYFGRKGLLENFDFADLPETRSAPLHDAIEQLPAGEKASVDNDFLLIHALADEQGVRAMLDESDYRKINLVAAFDKLDGHHAKAMWALLEHRSLAEVAGRFCEAEQQSNTYWHRRRENVPTAEPRDDAVARKELADEVAAHYRKKEGRGSQCEVEVYRRGTGYYFFALPEDYGQSALEYDETGLQLRPRRPVFEVVFVYDPIRPALDTLARGKKATRLELERIFGRVILRQDFAAERDDKVYDLNRFKQRGVTFVYDSSAGIDDVRVRLLRFFLRGGARRRLTLEADPTAGKDAVYDFVDDAFGHAGNGQTGGLSLALANVTRVGIHVTFTGERRGRKATKTFFLTYPNGCTLGQDGVDAVLRQMLIRSNIEPASPAAAIAAG